MSSRNSNGLKEKNLGTSGPGGEHPLRAHQAYAFVAFVAGHPQAFHLYAEDPCTGEAAIMMYTDTKKDGHMMVEIHYNESHHEHTPRGGGASEGCRPKLPRWPFSAPAAPKLRGARGMAVW
jgi:hypothetical protein